MNITPGEVVDDHTDVITARRYGHGALDRPVVRLVPRSLGPAEDLSLEFLGFAEPERVSEVGSGRREAIGFPAWALVNDPANAHHALNLVKDVEKLARTAKSKPGATKDGFDRLAEMLGRSAPHFLPTFYEQAGRVFVEAGNLQYAGTMLSKAREAEEVHSLDVDTVHQRQVFLEFALAGALSAKAITKYARTLAARRSPVEAYEEFTALCVERTKGGLPPYAGMQDDLRRLAKAAELDLSEVEQDFLRQVLGAPAITRASHSFWSSYRKSLVTLAKREPEVRARLLEIVPEVAAQDLWVRVLVESGAATALVDGEPGAAAAWMSRFVPSRVGYWQRPVVRSAALTDLVIAMAPRLRADGVPVEVLNRQLGTDLDVLDVCLAADVPLATWPDSVDPRQRHPQLAVEEWLADDQPGRRDLTALAGNETARALLADRLVKFVLHGKKTVDLDLVLGVPGLRTVLRHWLADRAEEVNEGSAVTIRHVLDVLRPVRSAAAFADVPEAAQRIAGTDVAKALAASLRGGLFAEFGWPALEDAIASLGSTQNGDSAVVAGEGWPALVVNRGDRFVVVGPDGILVDHVLRMAPEYRPTWRMNANAGYVDGQLYIGWNSPKGSVGYWTGDPDTVVSADLPWSWRSWQLEASIPVPGGGVFTGVGLLHAGDTKLPDRLRVHSDGVSCWRIDYSQGKPAWREVDPATGDTGRLSYPTWIESYATDGTTLVPQNTWLRPAPPGTTESPIGHRDGMLGFRVRQEADGTWSAERIDGGTVRTVLEPPIAALTFPGADEPRAVTMNGRLVTLHSPSGLRVDEYEPQRVLAEDTYRMPPLAWWPCLRVRDAAGSLALREVTDSQAQQLIDGASVADVLPAVTHPGLVAGVQRAVAEAVEQVAELVLYRDLATHEPALATTIGDSTMYEALWWFGRTHFGGRTLEDTILWNVAALGTLARQHAAGEPLDAKLFPDSNMLRHWSASMVYPYALAWRASLQVTPAVERTALVAFLRAVAAQGIVDSHWRVVGIARTVDGRPSAESTVLPTADGFIAVWGSGLYAGGVNAIQYSARAGKFSVPSGWETSSEQTVDDTLSASWIEQFCAEVEARGPVPWQQSFADVLSERTGLSRAEAAYLLSGMPFLRYHSDKTVMDAEAREVLGLNVNALRSARGRFMPVRGNPLVLLSGVLPDSPSALWTTGPEVVRLADRWVDRFGQRTPVPDDLLTAASKLIPMAVPAEYVSAAANPDATWWLTTDSVQSFADGVLTTETAGFEAHHLTAMRNVLPWLAYHLPVGSPIRAQLPRALELVRERMRNRSLYWDLGKVYESNTDLLTKLLGLAPDELTADVAEFHLENITYYRGCSVYLRVADFRGGDMLKAVRELIPTSGADAYETLTTLLNLDLTAGGGDPSAYYQDPYVSVPDLVSSVAAEYEVDSDVAALYLQLLALPDPTDANVAKWTGWKPARLKAARAALSATDLVLTAKRARAGRSLFLPGEWLALKAPHWPLEAWKTSMYGFDRRPVGAITPLGPVPDLFRHAWQRVLDGDAPAYEELRT